MTTLRGTKNAGLLKRIGKYALILISICIAYRVYPAGMELGHRTDGLRDSSEWKNEREIFVKNGMTVEQEFSPKTDFLQYVELAVTQARNEESGESRLLIGIKDSNGAAIEEKRISFQDIARNVKTRINFDTRLNRYDTYTLTLSAEGNTSCGYGILLVDRSAAASGQGSCSVNGNITDGIIVAEINYRNRSGIAEGVIAWSLAVFLTALLLVPWKKYPSVCLKGYLLTAGLTEIMIVGFREYMLRYIMYSRVLILLYLLICAAAVSVLIVHCIMLAKAQKRPEHFFAVSALGWGIIYLLLMPPFSYPDEPTHFSQANRYSNILMGIETRDADGQILIREEDLIPVVSFPDKESLKRYYSGNPLGGGRWKL